MRRRPATPDPDTMALAARAARDPVRERMREIEAQRDPSPEERAELAAWREAQLAAKASRDTESAARAERIRAEQVDQEAKWDAERGPKIEAARARRRGGRP